jgi:hypothetical protein
MRAFIVPGDLAYRRERTSPERRRSSPLPLDRKKRTEISRGLSLNSAFNVSIRPAGGKRERRATDRMRLRRVIASPPRSRDDQMTKQRGGPTRFGPSDVPTSGLDTRLVPNLGDEIRH